MTYEMIRAELDNLNARVRSLPQPRFSDFADGDVAGYVAACEIHDEKRGALHAEAKAKGFIRIFDGSYKLNATQAAL